MYKRQVQGEARHLQDGMQRILFLNQMLWQSGHELVGLGRFDALLFQLYEQDLPVSYTHLSILVICSLCLCFTYRQQAALQLHRSLHIATYFIGIYILQLPLLTMTSPLFQFILQWPFSTIWYFLFSNFVFVVDVYKRQGQWKRRATNYRESSFW